VTAVAATKNPGRVMSPEQVRAMYEREETVLRERAKGKSFYKIEREFGIPNSDRVWRRAIQRDENIAWRRAEAIRLEEERLDNLQEGVWDKALGGDARAVEVALKVLERRARMLGLDFADYLSGQMVEVEQAKVRLMGTALVTALQALDLSEDDRRTATAVFFEALRAEHARALPAPLSPEDEALL